MATNLAIDNALLEEALAVSGERTKKATGSRGRAVRRYPIRLLCLRASAVLRAREPDVREAAAAGRAVRRPRVVRARSDLRPGRASLRDASGGRGALFGEPPVRHVSLQLGSGRRSGPGRLDERHGGRLSRAVPDACVGLLGAALADPGGLSNGHRGVLRGLRVASRAERGRSRRSRPPDRRACRLDRSHTWTRPAGSIPSSTP